jgi:hypothetical protein
MQSTVAHLGMQNTSSETKQQCYCYQEVVFYMKEKTFIPNINFKAII